MQYNPITVTDLNKYIKGRIDNDEMLNNVLVKGEISNFKNHYTGHMYFTLKDEKSVIKCVMFKSSTSTLNFIPKDGMKVLILGTVAVYEAGRSLPNILQSNARRWYWRFASKI